MFWLNIQILIPPKLVDSEGFGGICFPMEPLIGRTREQTILRNAAESPGAELVAIFGRRRVGKTFLVRSFFEQDICFELVGVYGAPLREQLRSFAAALASAMKASIPPEPPADWATAFQHLASYLGSLPKSRRKRVVFLDELPWLASKRSGFLRAFEHFWNSWAVKRPNLVVVVCGSAASWMIKRLLNAKGGLHNRVTRRVRLEPFSLNEVKTYLTSRNIRLETYPLIELAMAFGGIPHYLKEIARGESPAQSIDRVCFSKDGLLRDEFSRIYASLFEHGERHEQVVRALANAPHGLTRNEILSKVRLPSGGGATTVLDELEESGFLMRCSQFGLATKHAVFRLADEYSLFYLNWIERHKSRAENVWLSRRGTPRWRAWSGLAFEGICLRHIRELKRALGIAAVETQESAWHHRPQCPEDRGVQVDLLIDRADGCINLCEMKFSEAPFVIDKRYATELRLKRETLRRVTKTRKAILITMVTTHGVIDNAYRTELVDVSIEAPALLSP